MKIALVGDIGLFGRCSTKGNVEVKKYFSEVSEHLSKFDLVVGNLETPFSEKKKIYGAKSAYICADPIDLTLLKMIHISGVTLANNHIYDYGKEGVKVTKKLLKENGIEFFGMDGEDWKFEKDNNKLAFNGFCCYSTNPLNTVPYGMPGVNQFNVCKAKTILAENAKNGYLNIFAVHAGIEHVNYPSLDTVKVAHDLAEIAPYIYYGHHPHVAQGIELVNNSFIIYSLGNFCFDDVYSFTSMEPLVRLSENNRSSFIFESVIENNKVVSYNTTPIYIGTDKLYVGKGIFDVDLKKYTEPIYLMPANEYNAKRNKIISSYMLKRKSQRNLMWILKRLTLRYIKLYFSNKKQRKKYFNNVKRYL